MMCPCVEPLAAHLMAACLGLLDQHLRLHRQLGGRVRVLDGNARRRPSGMRRGGQELPCTIQQRGGAHPVLGEVEGHKLLIAEAHETDPAAVRPDRERTQLGQLIDVGQGDFLALSDVPLHDGLADDLSLIVDEYSQWLVRVHLDQYLADIGSSQAETPSLELGHYPQVENLVNDGQRELWVQTVRRLLLDWHPHNLTGLRPSPTRHAVVGFRFSGRLAQGPAVRLADRRHPLRLDVLTMTRSAYLQVSNLEPS